MAVCVPDGLRRMGFSQFHAVCWAIGKIVGIGRSMTMFMYHSAGLGIRSRCGSRPKSATKPDRCCSLIGIGIIPVVTIFARQVVGKYFGFEFAFDILIIRPDFLETGFGIRAEPGFIVGIVCHRSQYSGS